MILGQNVMPLSYDNHFGTINAAYQKELESGCQIFMDMIPIFLVRFDCSSCTKSLISHRTEGDHIQLLALTVLR